MGKKMSISAIDVGKTKTDHCQMKVKLIGILANTVKQERIQKNIHFLIPIDRTI